jgi:hypothetical protein
MDTPPYEEHYKLEDFPSIESLVYCKRMVDLVYYDTLDDDAPENESADDALHRRTEQGKCVREANFSLSEGGLAFAWRVGSFKAGEKGKIRIRRPGDMQAWKHDLQLTQVEVRSCRKIVLSN